MKQTQIAASVSFNKKSRFILFFKSRVQKLKRKIFFLYFDHEFMHFNFIKLVQFLVVLVLLSWSNSNKRVNYPVLISWFNSTSLTVWLPRWGLVPLVTTTGSYTKLVAFHLRATEDLVIHELNRTHKNFNMILQY